MSDGATRRHVEQHKSAAGAPPVVEFFFDPGVRDLGSQLVQGRELRIFDGQPFVRAAALWDARRGLECRVWAHGHWMRGQVSNPLRTRVRVLLNPVRGRASKRVRDFEVREVWLRSTWPPGMGAGAGGCMSNQEDVCRGRGVARRDLEAALVPARKRRRGVRP